jgi:tetratricopeptide (TPR) repeat protein
MLMPSVKSHLTPLERHQVRSLILRDSVALVSIFLITVGLAVATYFLFNSYSDHRAELANRWFNRGKASMQSGQPGVAIDDFHSALLYARVAEERPIEIALASALASAGKLQEATAYFNTLRESEPGNGEINLQLARLAARSGNPAQAKLYFHAAIYGNWEGDGYLQRRNARLELVRYLISQRSFDQARSELLVASGNAPSSDLEMQSTIAALLIEDHNPADALSLYQQILAQHPDYMEALEGAASTAYSGGDYQLSFRYLERANAEVSSSSLTPGQHQSLQERLHRLERIVVLDPSASLPPATVAARLLEDRGIAHTRFKSCLTTSSSGRQTGDSSTQKMNADPAEVPPALQPIAARWSSEPSHLTVSDLKNDPAAEERELRLINDTETATASVCGEPTGDDAALLRLAQVPSKSDMPFVPPQALPTPALTGAPDTSSGKRFSLKSLLQPDAKAASQNHE